MKSAVSCLVSSRFIFGLAVAVASSSVFGQERADALQPVIQLGPTQGPCGAGNHPTLAQPDAVFYNPIGVPYLPGAIYLRCVENDANDNLTPSKGDILVGFMPRGGDVVQILPVPTRKTFAFVAFGTKSLALFDYQNGGYVLKGSGIFNGTGGLAELSPTGGISVRSLDGSVSNLSFPFLNQFMQTTSANPQEAGYSSLVSLNTFTYGIQAPGQKYEDGTPVNVLVRVGTNEFGQTDFAAPVLSFWVAQEIVPFGAGLSPVSEWFGPNVMYVTAPDQPSSVQGQTYLPFTGHFYAVKTNLQGTLDWHDVQPGGVDIPRQSGLLAKGNYAVYLIQNYGATAQDSKVTAYPFHSITSNVQIAVDSQPGVKYGALAVVTQ